MSASSVNLLWQKRFRGLLPVVDHNLTDEGTALLIQPDPIERRVYQVLNLDPDGNAREVCAVSVETVQQVDATPDGRLLLAITNDDLYVFRDGKKARFMADQRQSYVDICLAPEPGWFVAGYSDALFSSHGIAFGDANGRLGWTHHLDAPVNRVSISLNGRCVLLGLGDGQVRALDSMRNALWTYEQPEPISALAMPASAPAPIVGTEWGTLLALDAEGGVRWRCPAGLPVIAVATDREGQTAAAVLSDGVTHLLTCVGSDGRPIWEHELETRPTGVCLSANGRYLLYSLSNGGAALFEVDLTQSAALGIGSRRDRDLEVAGEAAAAGDLDRARELLAGLLAEARHDVEIAEELVALESRMVADYRQQAGERVKAGRERAAMELLDAAQRLDPWNEELFRERAALRARMVEGCRERALTLVAEGRAEETSAAWTELLTLAPGDLDARRGLAELRRRQAESLAEAAQAEHARGNAGRAAQLWEEAQRLSPSEETAQRLRRAEAERCVAAGIAYYEAQRLPEAVFQLKKALALDPGNEPARRYLGYAEGQTGDTLIADRFSHLE